MTTTRTTHCHYEAFRRARGLWADADGNFFTGEFADSPHAVLGEPVTFVGWIAGTEAGEAEIRFGTPITFRPLSDVESIEFMETARFVLYGEPDGEAAYRAAFPNEEDM